MNKKFQLSICPFPFLIVLLIICIISTAFTQPTTLLNLGGKTYVFEDSTWFVRDYATSEKYRVNETSITVKLKENIPRAALSSINDSLGIIIKNSNKLGYIDLEIPTGLNIFQIWERYSGSGLFESVEINSFGRPLINPNDPYCTNQYYLDHSTRPDINAPEAWDICIEHADEIFLNLPSIIIAVIDDGIQLVPDKHEDLGNICDFGWDYVEPQDDNPDSDGQSHGTHVAGIATALTNNSVPTGIAGIAGGWGSYAAQIMPIRVMYWDDELQRMQILNQYVDDAIIYAADHFGKIINMSFESAETYAIKAALKYAYSTKERLLVAAAGNYIVENSPIFPARDSHVMAVTGITWKWFKYGNRGNEIEITAPADDIFSTKYTPPGYGNSTGTSMSSPQVAGAAALIWAFKPGLINMDIRNIINQSAYDIGDPGFDSDYGNGLLKLDQALMFADPVQGLLPEKPDGITINAPIGGNPTITWNSVPSLASGDYYNVYRAVSYDGKYELYKIATVNHNDAQPTHSYTDTRVGVVPPKFAPLTYYYRVTGVWSTDELESIASNEVSCTSNTAEKPIINHDFETVYDYRLYNSYPNPFNATTKITYSIKEDGIVNIKIYDILGREIKELVNDFKEAGKHNVIFEDNNLASGIYIYSIISKDFSDTKKLLLIR